MVYSHSLVALILLRTVFGKSGIMRKEVVPPLGIAVDVRTTRSAATASRAEGHVGDEPSLRKPQDELPRWASSSDLGAYKADIKPITQKELPHEISHSRESLLEEEETDAEEVGEADQPHVCEDHRRRRTHGRIYCCARRRNEGCGNTPHCHNK